MKYKWLHISDLHSVAGIQTEIMRLSLLKEVEENVPFSFILITGDISDKNEGYDKARELINAIAQKAIVQKDRIFIVPGNHDVNRIIPDERAEKCRALWSMNELLGDERVIDDLTKGQAEFFSAYEAILSRPYPESQLHYTEKIDDNLTIVNLNTAWMCFDSNNESGKLHLGLTRLNNALKQTPKFGTTPIKIAIGHHRISDFNPVVRNNFKTLLKHYEIDLYLGGHCHESEVVYDPTIEVEFCACRQARAEDKNYPAGFIIGNIDTDIDQSYFEFYSWDVGLSKWIYDYSVSPAKHGKYYLNHPKYKTSSTRSVVVDLKLMGARLDSDAIMNKYRTLGSAEFYSTSLVNFRPNSECEWVRCFDEIMNLCNQVVKTSRNAIHLFPLAPIPALVYFGYLIQNNTPNISIYQYSETQNEWVFNEISEIHQVFESHIEARSDVLAVAINVSAVIKNEDIQESLNQRHDLYSISIENPGIDKVRYKSDVEHIKGIIQSKLNEVHSRYREIHLFIAAPAGLCVEIGRIIRENMFPNTFTYQYSRTSSPKYSRIANLMHPNNDG